MTGQPECWGLATVLVWLAMGDHEAFRIPAGRFDPAVPAQCIFDDDDGSSYSCVLAAHYIRAHRRGTITDLTPEEEVAAAKRKLLKHLECGGLSAWVDGTEWQGALWIDGGVGRNAYDDELKAMVFTSTRQANLFARHRISFKREDIFRNWPAKKPGPKAGQPSFKAAHYGKAEELLNAGTVQPGRGAIAEIIRIIQGGAPWTGCDESTIRKNITPAVNAWIERRKPAA